MAEKLMDRKELMATLRVTTKTVCNWIKQGKLHAYRVGNKTLFDREEVEKFLNERRI